MPQGKEHNQEKRDFQKREQRRAEQSQLRTLQRKALLAEAAPSSPDSLRHAVERFFPGDRRMWYEMTEQEWTKKEDHIYKEDLVSLFYNTEEQFPQGGIFYFLFTLATTSNNPTELQNIFSSIGAVASIMRDYQHPWSSKLRNELNTFLNKTPQLAYETFTPAVAQVKEGIAKDAQTIDTDSYAEERYAHVFLSHTFFAKYTNNKDIAAELFLGLMIDNQPGMLQIRDAIMRQAINHDITNTLSLTTAELTGLIGPNSTIWERMDATWINPEKYGKANFVTVDVDETGRLQEKVTSQEAENADLRQRLSRAQQTIERQQIMINDQAARARVAEQTIDGLRAAIRRESLRAEAAEMQARISEQQARRNNTPEPESLTTDSVRRFFQTAQIDEATLRRMPTQQREDEIKRLRTVANLLYHPDKTVDRSSAERTRLEAILKAINGKLDDIKKGR